MFLPLNVQGFLKFDLSKADKGLEAERTWAEGVQETGEEKKKGREEGAIFKEESVCYYNPLKNMMPLTFFYFRLTPPRL